MHSVIPMKEPLCKITLDIHLLADIPVGDSLYVTGNLPELGNWDPAGTLLQPKSPGHYEIELSSPAGSIIECKLTRGTWKTQGIYSADDIPPSNLVIKAEKSCTIHVNIIDWLDKQITESDPVIGKIVDIEVPMVEGLKYQPKVKVYLPEYYSDAGEPSAVIYMHDGQNLFEPKAAFAGVDWKVDETVTRLIASGEIRKCIVVAINNSPDRMEELNLFTKSGQAYCNFVVNILKPIIDTSFNVAKDPQNTIIMGSSMGGLMSFQMAITRPDIFGGAGCLSPAFGKTYGKIFNFVEKNQYLSNKVRIYLDTGEYEPPIVKTYFKMLKLLKTKGFIEGYNLMGFFDEKATHCEAAWAKRLPVPLKFLLSK
ncbi:MAG: alpha/beta hydrolase-fold protein [Candidatus Rifleibacteriota bacterium]